jgi:zinc protease
MYSFLRFETIEEFAEKGFYLFCEMLNYPAFDSDEVEGVRRSLLGRLGRDAGQPRKVARQLFYENLFEGNPYGRAIEGTSQSIAAITVEDLRAHHDRFYSPENLIVTIVTSRPADEISGWVNRVFGRVASGGLEPPEPVSVSPVVKTRELHQDLESEQVAIFLGGILPAASSPDAVALSVATSILSTRLYLNLREKQGLAYSVGAGARFDRDLGWYYGVISTGSDNYQAALDGILLEIEKLRYDGPTREELATARNSIWGRLQSARLSRINQAYYMARNEYLGRELDYDQKLLRQLQGITPNDIRRVMARHYNTEAYVAASAGKRP